MPSLQPCTRPAVLALLLASAPAAGGQETPLPRPEPFAITHVGVIPVATPGVLEDHTVVVREGRIASVEPADRADVAGLAVVDGRGRFLVPGLADMHLHLPRGAQPFTLEQTFDLLLVAGVTTARSMRGAPEDVRLRAEIERGTRAGPHLLLGSPGVDGDLAPTPAAARALVRRFEAEGYDFVKVLEGFDGASFEALADEARRLGLPLAGHLSDAVDLDAALAALGSIEHLHGHAGAMLADRPGFAELAERTARAGAWVCPTLAFQASWYAWEEVAALERWPGAELLPAALRREHVERALERADVDALTRASLQRRRDASLAAVRALLDAGVGLLVSPSGGWFLVPGFGVQVELRWLARAGLDPAELLHAATRNGALWAGEGSERGAVLPGCRADLVLLEANPLEDVRAYERVVAVVRAGRLHDRADLDRRLAELRGAR